MNGMINNKIKAEIGVSKSNNCFSLQSKSFCFDLERST